METASNYDKLRQNAANFYENIGNVFCPALNQKVYFSSEGFNHLIYKKGRAERERNVQISRFKILPAAPKIIGLTTTYQEYEETLKEVEVKIKKKRRRVTKISKFWGFIAIMKNRKVKVILRQVGDNGQIHFWSIIPSWQTNQYRDMKLFSTMKGNPEED